MCVCVCVCVCVWVRTGVRECISYLPTAEIPEKYNKRLYMKTIETDRKLQIMGINHVVTLKTLAMIVVFKRNI